MRLTERIYLGGGGSFGFGISEDRDCHVYLIDGGNEMALIDAGAGITIEPVLDNIRFDGLNTEKITSILLTHAHADHAGGAFEWSRRFGSVVAASVEAAGYVKSGDEEKISLAIAKQGGFYPQDYQFHACPVPNVLREGNVFKIGDLELIAIETPGHCSGMLSFLLKEKNRTILFAGDTVFHDGKIMISNVWDCDLQQYVKSIQKLAAYKVDCLLPGHLAISLSDGSRHIRKAWETLQKLSIPPSII